MAQVEMRSLHLGVNEVNPKRYGGKFKGNLKGCANDAKFMESIARARNFETTCLIGPNATREIVLRAIGVAAGNLAEGSFFLLTFAGHGNRIPASNPGATERFDQSWCLFDDQIFDNELFALWPTFRPKVRILVISDSCYSGSVLSILLRACDDRHLPPFRIRTLPLDVAEATFEQNEKRFEEIRAELPQPSTTGIAASVLSISACQDDEVAADGFPHGAFTKALTIEWRNGNFRGSHERLWFRSRGNLLRTEPQQHATWDYAGTLDEAFWHGEAFKL